MLRFVACDSLCYIICGYIGGYGYLTARLLMQAIGLKRSINHIRRVYSVTIVREKTFYQCTRGHQVIPESGIYKL